MGRKGVNYEQVAQVADDLLAEGVAARAIAPAAIRVRLGTGSNTTIGDHLSEWRQKRADASATPVHLALPAELAQPIATYIKAQCAAARAPVDEMLEGERIARATADAETQKVMEELDAARARIGELEVAVAENVGRLKQAQGAYEALEVKLAAAQRQAADAEKVAAVAEARFEAAERRSSDAENRTAAAVARAEAAESRAAEAESHAAVAAARAGASTSGR